MDKRNSPMGAKTNDAICQLQTDNFATRKNGWQIMLGDDCISLFGPKKFSVDIPRLAFDSLVKWYIHPQQLNKGE